MPWSSSQRISSMLWIRTVIIFCVTALAISVFLSLPKVQYLDATAPDDPSFFQPERSQVYDQHMLPSSTSTLSTMMAVTSSPPPISIEIPPAIQKEASACGRTWNIFLEELNKNINTEDDTLFVGPLVWTVSGGPEYRKNLKMLLDHWHLLDPTTPILVLGLDEETVKTACAAGYAAVYWDLPARSYSRVADAKFLASAGLANQGIDALFMELDVFCRLAPLPLFQQQADMYIENKKNNKKNKQADIVSIGHGENINKINIGMYYVKAKPQTRDFFDTLAWVLSHSLKDNRIMNGNGGVKKFFDQEMFQYCIRRMKWYHASDKDKERNLLVKCERQGFGALNFTLGAVSNELISSHEPPISLDSTYCVHPLSGSPFSSFSHKLATGKILGYDPQKRSPDDRLLKISSGDLHPHEQYSKTFPAKQFQATNWARKNVQYQVALLVHFAKETNRTLVLPRHLREQKGGTFPVYSLVDVSSIESMGVPWRFLSIEESRQLQDRTTVLEIIGGSSLPDLLQQTRDCDTPICALHGIHKVASSYSELDGIISKLTWCLKKYDDRHPEIHFGSQIGGYDRLCNRKLSDKKRK
jgi:hypothetical protein